MSCERMEKQMLPYVDGRLKESERAEVEKHLEGCAACRVRVNAFRAVGSLLDELPQIEPSGAFDARVHARVAAEPRKSGWLMWLKPSPRVAFAASLLVVATVWVATHPSDRVTPTDEAQIEQNLPVLENYDVLSDFGALTDLSQAQNAQPTDTNANPNPSTTNQSQQTM
ncbi:MAG TPA: zf-HC2 domain-containing protein [Candidatus Acidoferrum sp.]|nr:zf-HC2 domain-containing protein [Candidatus Acidoferrum sp.]